ISKPVDDLIDRSAAVQGAATPSAAGPPPPSPGTPPPSGGLTPVTSSNTAGSAASNNVTSQKIGREVGAPGVSVRGCVAGDTSPTGTVIEGYRKQIVSTPFGNQCSWIPAK